jgi:hypothetical protein
LTARVKDASPKVLQMFREAGMSPKQHVLSPAERLKVSNAFALLPPLHQSVLKAHLRSINFLDDMPNTALTSKLNPDDKFTLYDITFRAAILQQNLTQWITEKERSCFRADDPALSVSILAGEMDAIAYILMHEATHVVDGSLEILPKNEITKGVWLDRTTIAPAYHTPLLDSTRYRGGKQLASQQALAVYQALRNTPFVSLYSTSSQHEDLAEFLTVYDFTQKIKQPFRIVISKNGREIFSYEPMKSKLVSKRIRYLAPFYSTTQERQK